eukprot:scaffold1757_cov208-Chaetoceros_neogracile.AAC.1
MGSEEDKKKQRKEKLKEEAEKLGISYKELKEQKKSAKEKKKRSREADGLTNTTQKDDAKRMRTWSHDENDPEQQDSKKRRTRSMDAKEEEKVKKDSSGSMSPEEWRKDQHITIKGHGKYNGQGAESFPRPFFKFTEAPFSAAILKSFDKEGFTSPTAIQSQAWPIALQGDDMICIAKTGSGKTCGFLLPTIHLHQASGASSRGFRKPVLLVLAPTRELAIQIMEETSKFGRVMGITAVCCYGGSPKYTQISALQRGVDCVIATPGRLNDLLEMRKADLSGIKY